MVGGGGKAQAAIERVGGDGRKRENIGSDRERWVAEGRLRQRQGEVGGERKAQAATGKDGSRRDGTCSDRERWKAVGMHRQRQGEVKG